VTPIVNLDGKVTRIHSERINECVTQEASPDISEEDYRKK